MSSERDDLLRRRREIYERMRQRGERRGLLRRWRVRRNLRRLVAAPPYGPPGGWDGGTEAVKTAFNAIHQRAFGYHDPDQALEVVSVRLAAVARRSDVARSLQASVQGVCECRRR